MLFPLQELTQPPVMKPVIRQLKCHQQVPWQLGRDSPFLLVRLAHGIAAGITSKSVPVGFRRGGSCQPWFLFTQLEVVTNSRGQHSISFITCACWGVDAVPTICALADEYFRSLAYCTQCLIIPVPRRIGSWNLTERKSNLFSESDHVKGFCSFFLCFCQVNIIFY